MPTPEAPAAPIADDSARAGHDRGASTSDSDHSDEGRKLVIASAYGAPDVDTWVDDAQDMGVTVMRLTDIVETSLEDCLTDPEDKYVEMDAKALAAVEAGMGVVLDLSFIRNAAVREGINPYQPEFDWTPYVTPLLQRPFPTGGTYGTSEHVVYISLPGEPHVEWGDDPNEKADTAEDLIAFYQRLARDVRRAGVDRPLAAGGFIHHTADGNGTDAGLDITAVYSLLEIDVCTTHAYDQEALDALPMLTRYAHALGKPFILEETGRDAEELSDEERADWFSRVQSASRDAGVDGVGVWNVGQCGGFDVQPPKHPLAAAAVRRMADIDLLSARGLIAGEDAMTHGEHVAPVSGSAATASSAVTADSADEPADSTATADSAAEAGIGAGEDVEADEARVTVQTADTPAGAVDEADETADDRDRLQRPAQAQDMVESGGAAVPVDAPTADSADQGTDSAETADEDGDVRTVGAAGGASAVSADEAEEAVEAEAEDAVDEADAVDSGDDGTAGSDDVADAADGADISEKAVDAAAVADPTDMDSGARLHAAASGDDAAAAEPAAITVDRGAPTAETPEIAGPADIANPDVMSAAQVVRAQTDDEPDAGSGDEPDEEQVDDGAGEPETIGLVDVDSVPVAHEPAIVPESVVSAPPPPPLPEDEAAARSAVGAAEPLDVAGEATGTTEAVVDPAAVAPAASASDGRVVARKSILSSAAAPVSRTAGAIDEANEEDESEDDDAVLPPPRRSWSELPPL